MLPTSPRGSAGAARRCRAGRPARGDFASTAAQPLFQMAPRAPPEWRFASSLLSPCLFSTSARQFGPLPRVSLSSAPRSPPRQLQHPCSPAPLPFFLHAPALSRPRSSSCLRPRPSAKTPAGAPLRFLFRSEQRDAARLECAATAPATRERDLGATRRRRPVADCLGASHCSRLISAHPASFAADATSLPTRRPLPPASRQRPNGTLCLLRDPSTAVPRAVRHATLSPRRIASTFAVLASSCPPCPLPPPPMRCSPCHFSPPCALPPRSAGADRLVPLRSAAVHPLSPSPLPNLHCSDKRKRNAEKTARAWEDKKQRGTGAMGDKRGRGAGEEARTAESAERRARRATEVRPRQSSEREAGDRGGEAGRHAGARGRRPGR